MSADAAALRATAGHTQAATHAARGLGNPVLGMLLFITSEVMFFAGLFAAYFSMRAGHTEVINGVQTHVWPPTADVGILNPWRLTTDSGALNVIVPATLILVASSFVCQYGVRAIRRGDQGAFIRSMTLTLAMGVAFLLLQAYDYTVLMGEGLSLGSGPFGTTYFTLTGFHGLHVLGGALMLSVVVYRGRAKRFNSRRHDMVEAVSLYWHFVDVVWVVLFSVLYLV